MSVMIETTEELLGLLRKLNLKVSGVDELRHLLTTINANYNPQAARVRTAKLVALSVPCSLGGIAGVVSMLLTMATQGALMGPYFVGALALVWGPCALVSVTALIFSFALLNRRAPVPGDAPPSSKATKVNERLATAIKPDLSL